jgi:hypothetical protein
MAQGEEKIKIGFNITATLDLGQHNIWIWAGNYRGL